MKKNIIQKLGIEQCKRVLLNTVDLADTEVQSQQEMAKDGMAELGRVKDNASDVKKAAEIIPLLLEFYHANIGENK